MTTTNLWMEQQVSRRLTAQLKRQDLALGEMQIRAERAERELAELERKLATAEAEKEWIESTHADFRARVLQALEELSEGP